MNDKLFLFAEWCSAHLRAGVRPSLTEFNRVVEKYSEDGRYYHDLSHIIACLRFINRFFPKAKKVHLVKLAIFYHDYEMVFGRKDNELRSAQKWDTRTMFSRSVRRRVHDLIMLTAGHNDAPDELSQIMNDADLHILGQSRGLYMDYARGIWKEYSSVGVDAYTAGRMAFLREFIKKPIFKTQKMIYLLESAAINNLKAELQTLRYRRDRIIG